MFELGCTLPNLAIICLHNMQLPNSILSRRQIRSCWRNSEEILLVVLLSFLHAEQLLMKHLLESLRTHANQLLKLIIAKYIHVQQVNTCQPVFTRIGISIQRQIDSQLDETRPVASRVLSCPTFNEQEEIAKSRASIQQADSKMLTVSALMVFVLLVNM